jgi:sugar phosphate isomerase/epimerase
LTAHSSRIAISSPWFSKTPVEEMAPAIAAEFSCWEIVGEYKHHLSISGPFLKEFRKSHPLKLQVHAPLSDINIASFSEKVREASITEVSEAVRMAAGFGAEMVTFHPGHLSPVAHLDPGRLRDMTTEAVLRIAKAGREHGVPLAIENMPKTRMTAFKGPADLLECVEGTDVGLCLDVGHANTTGNIDDYLAVADRVRNIHIHDNNGGWDDHLVLGAGNLPLAKIVSALKPVFRGRWVIESRDLAEGIRSRDVLEKMLE